MPPNALQIPKFSGTYADALLAYGVLRLLGQWFAQAGLRARLTLRDVGPAYQVQWEPPRALPVSQARYFASPAPFLLNRKAPEPPEPGFPVLDVEDLRERRDQYLAQRAALRRAQRGGETVPPELQQQVEDLAPRPEAATALFLGDWRMQALGGYNKIVAGWVATRGHFPEHLAALLAAAQGTWDHDARKAWRQRARADGLPPEVTASQLLNPHQGKGLNEPKGNALRMGNIKQPWPAEFLKAVGLWEAAFPRRTRDTQDWKVYILAPRQLPRRHLQRVYRAFHRVLWDEGGRDATTLKADITSVLLFFRTWLRYVEDWAAQRAAAEDMPPPDPAAVVYGFYVVQFKLLSANAYTMVNQSFLRLPPWGRAIQSPADVQAWQALIDEHLTVLRALDEGHSDAFQMLQHYRDFVAGNRWDAFFAFLRNYAHYALRQKAQNKYAPLFTTSHLRRLLMTEKRFTPILESEGFRNFAYAIRYSTVVPQFWKAQYKQGKAQEPPLYEVRYGLGEELKRKATVKEEFIAALMDFAQSYNRENAQVLESKGTQRRRDLRTSDIEDLVRLMDIYSSEVVANLLVAYGYAREPREEPEPEAAHAAQ